MDKVEYHCGYEIHTDLKPYVKLFVSSPSSKTIDIYDKYVLKKPLKDFELSDLFVPLSAVSFVLDIALRQSEGISVNDGETESISIISYLDSFNKYNIKIEKASELNAVISNIITSNSPNVLNNLYLYTLKYKSDMIQKIQIPENIEFAPRDIKQHLSFTLNDYYLNNETIICKFS